MNINLGTKEGYDLVAAIRGPDQAYPFLKHIITGWIRYKLGVSACDCHVRCEELTTSDILCAKREVYHLCECKHHHCAMLHWVMHTSLAIKWLRPCATSPVGRRERDLAHDLTGMMRNPSPENRDRVLECLDAWLDVADNQGGEKSES